MLINARKLPMDSELQADVCIVGAGAAGITLAKEFANTRIKVILLESGGMRFRHRTQHLYQAQNHGREYTPMEFTKRRQFGGSTVTWFGRCRPLDEIDFEKRLWVPYSGWPFARSHLDPFYVRARDYCQLISDNYVVTDDYFKNGIVETKRFYFSPPTNFGEMYADDLESAENIDVFLQVNVVHIDLNKDGTRVTGLKCKTIGGKEFSLNAKVFILAASALENTRLMLASRDVHSNGVGNQHDLVGRYFMEHPHFFGAAVESVPNDLPKNLTKLNYELNQKNLAVVDSVGLTQDAMRKNNLLNASAFIVSRPKYKTTNLYYLNSVRGFQKTMEVFQHSRPPSLDLIKNAADMFMNVRSVAGLLASAVQGRIKKRRHYALRLQVETAPNPESRVLLSDKKDLLGVQQLDLRWQTSSLDVESYQRFEQLVYDDLHNAGFSINRFRHDLSSDGWPVSMLPGKHHMGTTRMHNDEKQGVVDENCRVHGVANLFIAGSSVFPTSGMANPTLTIVALAIRLADQIKQKMIF